MFGIGIGESDSLAVAMKKSKIAAEFELAKTLGQELSGSEREYIQENSQGLTQQYEELIDKLVSNVPVVGFQVIKSETLSIDGKYHNFVMLKLPYDEFNAVIQQQRSATSQQTIKEAFEDLERRVENRRQQIREEQQPTNNPVALKPTDNKQKKDEQEPDNSEI